MRSKYWLTGIVGLSLTLAACGGSGKDSSTAAPVTSYASRSPSPITTEDIAADKLACAAATSANEELQQAATEFAQNGNMPTAQYLTDQAKGVTDILKAENNALKTLPAGSNLRLLIAEYLQTHPSPSDIFSTEYQPEAAAVAGICTNTVGS